MCRLRKSERRSSLKTKSDSKMNGMNGNINIVNVLGCTVAEVPVLPAQPLAVVGPNAAGKSSVALALAAALSHDSNPLKIATVGSYMNDHADFGEVLWTGERDVEYVRWVLSEKSIRVSSYAPQPLQRASVGLIDFVSQASARARSDVWESIFLPEPETLLQQVIATLKPRIKRDQVIEEVLDLLREQGWNHVEKIYQKKALEMKREWSLHSGQKYGGVVAAEWDPAGWNPELVGMTIIEAERAIAEAREVQRAVQITEGISELEAQKAREAKAELPALKEALEVAQKKRDKIKLQADEAEASIQAIRPMGLAAKEHFQELAGRRPERSDGVPCPHCGKDLYIRSGKLLPAETDAELEKRLLSWQREVDESEEGLEMLRAKMKAAKMRAAPILKVMEAAQHETIEADAAYRSMKRAAIQADKPISEDDRLDARIALAEQEVEERKKNLGLIQTRLAAATAQKNVLEYTAIAKVFGPQGIRFQAMKAGMERLGENLSIIQRRTNWPAIELDATYAVTIDRRPALVCATSEQWRAQICLQIAIALSVEDPAVVLDGADVLVDAFEHNEMSRLILLCDYLAAEKGVSVIVCASGEQTRFPEKWPYISIQGGKGVDL